MRVLALGCALPDANVDNYDWASALSFFDYDAIVVDPAEAVSKLIDSVVDGGSGYVTYEDEPVGDSPSTTTSVGLADLLRRRREETERLLARGGLVVCFAYPDVAHPRVAGFTGAHRYYWLPAPSGLDYGPQRVRPAGGTHVTPTDYEHPFAAFLDGRRGGVQYRALFAEGPESLVSQAKVIGRSPGGAPIALDMAVGGGRVILLPALPQRLGPAERAAIAPSLVAAIRNALLLGAEAAPPEWIDEHALPGLEQAQRRLAAAEAGLEAAEAEANEARNGVRAIDRYRRLLWQEGKYGLDLPVRDVLGLLGFTTYGAVDEPAAFLYDGDSVLIETEGSANAVGLEPHYRLRQRLEQKIAAEGRRVRGLVVVNGFRETPPSQRPQQYHDSLRIAAESMRYALVEATRLFDAAKACLEGDAASAKAFCRRLVDTEGVFGGNAVADEDD